MSKDIDLKSSEWNNIIFEGKNKKYGAYEMRQSSSKRHVMAFVVCILIVIFVSFLPALIETVARARQADNIDDSTVLANLQKQLEEEIQKQDEIRDDAEPPPPPLKSTIQFTAPDIVDASEINEEDQMKTQDELTTSTVQISIATVAGTDEIGGVDIAELKRHEEISETKAETIHEFVEQPAVFPGGEEALMKYLHDNISYPTSAWENRIQGLVYLRFVVNKEGRISDIKILTSVHPLLDNEAIRVVKSMPKWIPARHNGKIVNAYFILPVRFTIE